MGDEDIHGNIMGKWGMHHRAKSKKKHQPLGIMIIIFPQTHHHRLRLPQFWTPKQKHHIKLGTHVSLSLYIYIYTYNNTYIYVCIYIYISIHI